MKSLRWRYALADLFGLVLASAYFWTKVVAIQGSFVPNSHPGQTINKTG